MRVHWRTFYAVVLGATLSASISAAAQKVHVVVAGQTPAGIARRYGIPVNDLYAMNKLHTGSRLHVGQKLLIPDPGEVAKNLQRAKATKLESTAAPNTAEAAPEPVVEAAPVATGSAVQSPDQAEPAEADESTGSSESSSAPASHAPAVRVPTNTRTTASPAERHVKPSGERQTHVVAQGNTIGRLARRYHLREESLLRANGLRRTERLKLGQTLVIPSSDDDPIIENGPPLDVGPNKTAHEVERHGMQQLEVSGAGPVYYYEPTGPGHQNMRPLLVYLHGRGGDAEHDCKKWAPVARHFGWLVCPSGPVAYNSGRSWNNSWPAGQHAVMGAIKALRDRYGRRVQLFGNTLIGFSEGAFVAMNVGVREPKTFNRWLILGADTSYWGGSGLEALQDARERVRRVVLITGGRDQVVDDTRKVAEWLSRARVPIKIQTPGDLAHEVALERMPGLYENALRWLDKGGNPPPRASAQR